MGQSVFQANLCAGKIGIDSSIQAQGAGEVMSQNWRIYCLFDRSVWTRVITWLALASVISLILFLIAFVVAVTFGLFVHCKFWNSADLTHSW